MHKYICPNGTQAESASVMLFFFYVFARDILLGKRTNFNVERQRALKHVTVIRVGERVKHMPDLSWVDEVEEEEEATRNLRAYNKQLLMQYNRQMKVFFPSIFCLALES